MVDAGNSHKDNAYISNSESVSLMSGVSAGRVQQKKSKLGTRRNLGIA